MVCLWTARPSSLPLPRHRRPKSQLTSAAGNPRSQVRKLGLTGNDTYCSNSCKSVVQLPNFQHRPCSLVKNGRESIRHRLPHRQPAY